MTFIVDFRVYILTRHSTDMKNIDFFCYGNIDLPFLDPGISSVSIMLAQLRKHV